MGETRNTFRVLIRTFEGKRSQERPRRRWENYIKMNLREIEWEVVDWIYLAQDRDQ
jgi:hypothetical protein